MSNKNENIDDILDSIMGSTEKSEKESDSSVSEKTIRISDKDATSIFKINKDDHVKEYIPSNREYSDNNDHADNKTDGKVKKKKRKRKKRNYTVYAGIVLATLVVCISVLIALFIIVVGRDVLGIESAGNPFTIYIPEGSSTNDIADQLYDEGVIQYKKIFVLLSKIKDADGNMCPGDIEVVNNMSYSDIIDELMVMREAKATATITFPEGTTLLSAAKLLEENGVCGADDFIYTFNNTVYGYEFERYISNSSLKLYKCEGFMFPDTYEFYLGDSAYNIAKKIKSRTNQILNSDVIKKASDNGMTLDQVVTLASIVQKEAGSSEDMKKIASVFINRLNSPESYPRLQSDTSYSYINDVIKKVMTVEYQEMYDAYDTYICLGLPVGAICNPGEEAINAVLYPDDTEYYYFCSNLETKETYYARTYEEHLQNLKIAGLT